MQNCESSLENVIKHSSFRVNQLIYIFVHICSLQFPFIIVFSSWKLTSSLNLLQLLWIVTVWPSNAHQIKCNDNHLHLLSYHF